MTMPRRTRGFTLIEVLIALSLLALVMLGLVSALSTFGRTATSMETRFERSDEARLVSEFLREAIGRVSESHRMRGDDAAMRPMFEGTASELRWLGVMPARHGTGGLHHFRLSVGQDEFGPALMLQYRPYLGGNVAPDWSGVTGRVLLERLSTFDIAYAGEDESLWSNQWLGEEELPRALRLAIDTRDQVWPELVVRIRPVGRDSGGRIVIGGSEG